MCHFISWRCSRSFNWYATTSRRGLISHFYTNLYTLSLTVTGVGLSHSPQPSSDEHGRKTICWVWKTSVPSPANTLSSRSVTLPFYLLNFFSSTETFANLLLLKQHRLYRYSTTCRYMYRQTVQTCMKTTWATFSFHTSCSLQNSTLLRNIFSTCW